MTDISTVYSNTVSRLVKAKHFEAAAVVLRRILAVDPSIAVAWCNLAGVLGHLDRLTEAEEAARRALQLRPDFGQAWSNLGITLEGLGRFAEAGEAFDAAVAADDGPLIRFNRALHWLSQRHWGPGFKEYDARVLKYPSLPGTLWQGQSLLGKTLYVKSDQGIGDAIFFARFLPALARVTGRIYLHVPAEAEVLFAGYDEIVTLYRVGQQLEAIDYHIYLGSLPQYHSRYYYPDDPGFIRHSAEEFVVEPGLLPSPNSARPTFRVGVCWTGSATSEYNEQRSLPLPLLMTLAEDPRVWLYSLHVGEPAKQIAEIGAQDVICDLSAVLEKGGFLATAALMLKLDLIITTDCVIANLAGALGISVWVMLRCRPYWIWGHIGSTTPWYRSARLFRQPVVGDWISVITEVRKELKSMLDRKYG